VYSPIQNLLLQLLLTTLISDTFLRCMKVMTIFVVLILRSFACLFSNLSSIYCCYCHLIPPVLKFSSIPMSDMSDIVKDKLVSSDLQFGFKPNSSCSHAILALQAGVKHIGLCDNGGTATLCALDICKAFDRVNFYGLLKILVDCLFPKCFIDLLLDWFSKCISCVRWNGILSSPFAMYAGVRQGGLLSPALFAMHIDKLIQLLKSSGLGCRYNDTYIGCLCYADDSVTVMQKTLCFSWLSCSQLC